ncbi:MAG: type IX secretion system membrane protein PorP/SprF, partial [Candidatus Promineifilaceae bacterium]
MIRLLRKIGVMFLMSLSLMGYSQDPQFSQFYASPLYLNPAFTGNVDLGQFAFSYRNQWPGIPGKFISYSASYEHYF